MMMFIPLLCSSLGNAWGYRNEPVGTNVAALSRPANVAIIYSTESNHTRTLAEAIAGGVTSVGSVARVKSIKDADYEADVLEWADALILGSPTHFGNPSGAMLSWIEADWENFWTDPRSSAKYGAVFTTGGGMTQGCEHVLAGLTRVLWSFRFQMVTPDPTRSGFTSYGAVAITGTPPFNLSTPGAIAQPFVDAGFQLGADVAKRAGSGPPSV